MHYTSPYDMTRYLTSLAPDALMGYACHLAWNLVIVFLRVVEFGDSFPAIKMEGCPTSLDPNLPLQSSQS